LRVYGNEKAVNDVKWYSGGRVIFLRSVNLQKDRKSGEPYSLTVLLEDYGAVTDMKNAFSSHVADMSKHDRFYPRSGHITLLTKNRCPEIFMDA